MRQILSAMVVGLGLFGGGLAGIGCSSSSGSSANATPEEACVSVASALCDKYTACSSFFISFSYGDAATCKARAQLDCVSNLKAPSTGATPGQYIECGKTLAAAACADVFNGVLPAVCNPVAGKLTDGMPCGDSAQCVSTFCSHDAGSNCGKCTTKPAAGGACTVSCPDGLDCAGGKCSARGKLGSECGTVACESSLSCTDGRCTAAAKLGEACDNEGKGKPKCDLVSGLLCNRVSSKCEALKFVATGQPCGYDTATGVYVACGARGTCKIDDPTKSTMGVCQAPAKDGEACDNSKGPNCIAPADCIGNKCLLKDPASCK